MYFSVDNPGGGDCAFYAYAIALINVVKQEFRQNPTGRSKTFERWCASYPLLNEFKGAIISFNYRVQNDDLLQILQKSLRKVVFCFQHRQLIELSTAQDIRLKTIQQPVFCMFSEVFWHYYLGSNLDLNYNVLACSEGVRSLLKGASEYCQKVLPVEAYSSVKHDKRIHDYLVSLFLRETYGDHYEEPSQRLIKVDSMILHALGQVMLDRNKARQRGVRCYWGTHGDLNILSQAFDVSLHYLVNGEVTQHFNDISGRPVVIIDNRDNVHWVTRIVTSNALECDQTHRYLAYATNSLLSKQEIHQLFKTYTKGSMAFFHRHHLNAARKIIAACKDHDTRMNDVVQFIKGYISNREHHFNSDSSFMKRANYILARSQHDKEPELDLEKVSRLGLTETYV